MTFNEVFPHCKPEGKKELRRLWPRKDIIKTDIKHVVLIWRGLIWPGKESSGALV
jgi:hypothetical protein